MFYKLHKDKYGDLKQQQLIARQRLIDIQAATHQSPLDPSLPFLEKEPRCQYIDILSSSASLMKQQSKMEWIGHGNLSSKLFFAKTQ